jgi:hypothetical protein
MQNRTHSARFDRLPRTLAACAFLTAAAGTAGCFYNEGGLGMSEDKHVYVSRSHQPWTVTVRDTRTGQAFWSVDVPVGKKLVVQFLEGQGSENKFTPDLMQWGLMDESDGYGNLTNSLPVPARDVRRLEPTLRATPELPPEMTGRAVSSPPVQVR